jgi:glycosyltransferase 2 family protein
MPPTERRLGRLAVKALVAAILVAVLCLAVDLEEAAAAVRDAHLLPLMTALAVSVLGVLISAEKWRGLLHQARIRLSLAVCTRLYWIGMFVSNFLPTSVGGDAVRFVLTPAPRRRAAVAGSILVERLTGFLVMLGLCTLGLALRPRYFDEPLLRDMFLAAVLVLELGVIVALLVPGRLASLLTQLAERLPAILCRLVEATAGVARAVAGLTRHPAGLARAMGLSICFYGTIILAQHAVLRAVGAEVPLLEMALVAAVVPLLTLLPVSLNGLGMAEGVFVLLYTQLGVDAELALAAAVLRRVVDLANSGLGGLLWLTLRDETGEAQPLVSSTAAVRPSASVI